MVEAKFEVGDIVQLKSGGFNMTVMSIESKGLKCKWTLINQFRYISDVFHVKTLKKVSE